MTLNRPSALFSVRMNCFRSLWPTQTSGKGHPSMPVEGTVGLFPVTAGPRCAVGDRGLLRGVGGGVRVRGAVLYSWVGP
jgi:hypothetical protein